MQGVPRGAAERTGCPGGCGGRPIGSCHRATAPTPVDRLDHQGSITSHYVEHPSLCPCHLHPCGPACWKARGPTSLYPAAPCRCTLSARRPWKPPPPLLTPNPQNPAGLPRTKKGPSCTKATAGRPVPTTPTPAAAAPGRRGKGKQGNFPSPGPAPADADPGSDPDAHAYTLQLATPAPARAHKPYPRHVECKVCL